MTRCTANRKGASSTVTTTVTFRSMSSAVGSAVLFTVMVGVALVPIQWVMKTRRKPAALKRAAFDIHHQCVPLD